MRQACLSRETNETYITISLVLDGEGMSKIETDCGFLNHMLTLFAKHSGFNLYVSCRSDSEVDFHHTTEDIGILLGQAFDTAIGDKKGINRYGNMLLPMDEALILSAVDISGRGMLTYNLSIPSQKVGNFDTELTKEFFQSFAANAKITLHINQLSGENSHHIIEGAFKSVARSLKQAAAIDPNNEDSIPSTKGVL